MFTRIGQVFSPCGGQLPPPLIVFDHQASSNQEWFCHLGDGAGWQPEHRRDDIQAASPFPPELPDTSSLSQGFLLISMRQNRF
jgi:hypothetical protein